jgi:hypothetical protein
MVEVIEREDLAALVAMLQHEHFSYTDAGQKANRVLKALEAALRSGGQVRIVERGFRAESSEAFEPETGDRLAAAAVDLARELTVEQLAAAKDPRRV